MKRYSILMEMDHCLICKDTRNLHIHEVFGGFGKRDISIQEGLCVTLCPFHHNATNHSVHLNRQLDLKVKRWAQKQWQDKNKKTAEDFIKLFGKSYL